MNILLAALALPAVLQVPEACGKDRSGVAWIHPFPAAREAARKAGRPLLIKPIAFGTTPDGGW